MSIEVRAAADVGELDRGFMQIGQYFGAEPDVERAARFARVLPPERMHVAYDGETAVGGAGAFAFPLSVPGGAFVDCCGTTMVGVAPTHRRRGVLRDLLRAQLEDAHERGEPIAALWASEETIYGRFGFGRAAFAGSAEIPHEHDGFVRPVEPQGSFRFVEPDEALELFPPVWEAAARERPGMVIRSRDWWEVRVLRDAPERRQGGGPQRLVVLEEDGVATGYAIYRHHFAFSEGQPTSTLQVVEALGAPAPVWRYLLDVDWIATVSVSLLPPDHALFFLLAAPRRIRYRMGDGLWVRLLDLGAALGARTYAGDGEVVFDVRDAFCPWNEGRWRVGAGGVERTDAPAEIALDVRELGAAYLGGIGFRQLAQVGLVEELATGSVARADALFRSPLHPWCPEIF